MRTALPNRFIGSLLSDAAVLEAPLFAGQERSNAADLLVRIAEIDERKLYLKTGHSTLLAYCAEELRLFGDEAANRIYVARTARRFPVLFQAIDEGTLDLTRVRLFAGQLTEENADELVAAASACRHKSDLQAFLNRRFAPPDLLSGAATLPAVVQPNNLVQMDHSHVPEHVTGPRVTNLLARSEVETGEAASALEITSELGLPCEPKMAFGSEHIPLPVEALEWVDLKGAKARRAKWQYVCDLLSHSVPSGNVSLILDRALDALIEKTEKRRFAACEKPRAPRPAILRRQRTIPAHVRQAVVARDGARCTYVSESKRRCAATRLLEFDHILPVAQGGSSTVGNLRLRCRGHNQYEAERAFGAEFMKKKRKATQEKRAKTALRLPGQRFRDDVVAALRAHGVRPREAREIVERSGALQQTTLEASVRTALRCLGSRRQRSA